MVAQSAVGKGSRRPNAYASPTRLTWALIDPNCCVGCGNFLAAVILICKDIGVSPWVVGGVENDSTRQDYWRVLWSALYGV